MKLLKETFFERLRNRMAPANAVKTIAALHRASLTGTIEYMDVKEASDMLERYRLEARLAIRTYRRWQGRKAVTAALQPLKDQEGRILRDNARASASLYVDAMRDFRDLCRLAMQQYAVANDRGGRQ